MNFQIRLAQASDIEHLPAIEKAAAQRYRAYLPKLRLTPDKLDNIVSTDFLHQALHQKHLWVAVGCEHHRPVGFVVVDRLPRSYFVIELDVLPDYGRKGIGSALMQQVIAAARSQGLTGVTLTTFRHIPWTVPFYQQLGFKIVVPADYAPEIRAIVDHETRHGFSRQVRVVMQCPISPLNQLSTHCLPN